jgi:PAS domain S-box-containing protein
VNLSFENIGLKAVNDIPALLAYWDQDEICRFANSTFLEWLGKPPETLVGKVSMKDLLGTLYEKEKHYINEVLKGNKQSFERELITPNSNVLYTQVTYTPNINNGLVVGFTEHSSDITSKRHLELLMAKSEKRFRAILESAPDAMLLVNGKGIIELVNNQAEQMFGYSSLEMQDNNLELLIPAANRSKHKIDFEKYFDSASFRPMAKGLKLFGRRKNGELFRVEISLSPIHSEDGNLVISAIRDISERVAIEKKLEESYKQNSIFVEQAPNAIAMFDKEMHYIAASKKWIDDYGLAGQNVIGRSHYEIFPEIGENWKAIHKAGLKGAINQCDEAEFIRIDGSKQWLSWDVRPWYLAKDEIGGLLMYTADITHQKIKEQERRGIEEILDRTNEVARIGTWEVDVIHQKAKWSRITKEIHGVSDDFEPDLETAIEFYKPGLNREKMLYSVSEAIRIGTPYDIQVELITQKGDALWVRAIGQAEFENNKCKRLYGVFQDINASKNLEIQLNRANEELRVIFNSGSVSVIGTDLHGKITHFNRGAEEMLQYSAQEMIGINSPQKIHLEKEILERAEALSLQLNKTVSGFDVFVENSKLNDQDSQREWTYVRKDGSTFIVLLDVRPLINHLGEVFGYLGVATDINERAESERRLQEAKKNLEVLTERLTATNNQLANFAHITSHNLRSPVINLNALVHFYNDSESEEERRMIFGKFDNVLNHLSETLNTLLEALRIRDNINQVTKIIKFDDVFNKTKEMLVAQIMESKAQISADFSEAPTIDFNTVYLESILLNLISNSIKYKSPERAPIIQIKTKTINNKVVFTITDNGLGIDLNRHRHKLFGLHKTFHRNSEAKGVGLFLTKNHIESMGGTITAESEVNKGTTFTIYF